MAIYDRKNCNVKYYIILTRPLYDIEPSIIPLKVKSEKIDMENNPSLNVKWIWLDIERDNMINVNC